MQAYIIQHVPFEGPGSIAPWFDTNGYAMGVIRLFEGDALPAPGGADFLVVMGGPMSVKDTARYPWLEEEKAWLKEAIASETPVLGICLGAQLMAAALGAEIEPNPEKEIGWFPVRSVESDDKSIYRFPPSFEAFHWHGETFALPEGAIRLAYSEGCPHQAFQVGASAMGLQFHLETTPESAAALVEHCRDELEPSRYVQDEATILGASAERYLAMHELMGNVLAYLAENNGAGR